MSNETPQRGVERRDDIGQVSVRRSAELATSAAQSRAKAEIEAAFTVALHRPRNIDEVRVRVLEACGRPQFAAAALYAKPIGNKKMTGLSIRFAEEAARQMGNIRRVVETIYDDEASRIMRISVTDLETNYTASVEITIQKTVERKDGRGRSIVEQRANSYGDPVFIVIATEDELLTKQNNALSKAARNLLLDMIPGDITAEARAKIEAVRIGEVAADPAAARKALADAFYQLGVSPSALTAFLGHPLEQSSPAEISDLRDYYSAIKAGEATWSDIMRARDGERPEQAEPVAAKKREPITPTDQPQQYANDEPQEAAQYEEEAPVDEATMQHATADFDSSPAGKRGRSMALAKELFAMGPAGKAALKRELEVAGIGKVQECPEDQLDNLIDGLQNQVDALGAK
jgi:hypothetical protein